MRLTVGRALTLALIAVFLPGCDRTATDREEAASKGQTPAGGATGQTSEGSANDPAVPARPASK